MATKRTVKCSCGRIIEKGCGCWDVPPLILRDACAVCQLKKKGK